MGKKICLGLEMPRLPEGQTQGKTASSAGDHGDVEPVPAQGRQVSVDLVDDFRPGFCGPADIGADKGSALCFGTQGQGQDQVVSLAAQQAASRSRVLDNGMGVFHGINQC